MRTTWPSHLPKHQQIWYSSAFKRFLPNIASQLWFKVASSSKFTATMAIRSLIHGLHYFMGPAHIASIIHKHVKGAIRSSQALPSHQRHSCHKLMSSSPHSSWKHFRRYPRYSFLSWQSSAVCASQSTSSILRRKLPRGSSHSRNRTVSRQSPRSSQFIHECSRCWLAWGTEHWASEANMYTGTILTI